MKHTQTLDATCPQVLFVDDEKSMRIAGEQCLMLADFKVTTCAQGKQALAHISKHLVDVIISDIRMPQMDGLELLEKIKQIDKDLPVILLTGHGDIDMAVQAMRDGAYDFQQKPFHPDRLVQRVTRAWQQRQLTLENRRLRLALANQDLAQTLLIGNSPQMQDLREQLMELANLPVNVLIQGETGSGKEQVAKLLHQLSHRHKAHLVAINCAAMPENLFESEIFGFEAGAFTGASQSRIGKIEHAKGGTLFLDEIESMPLVLQAKLLRVLQDKKIERLGSNQQIAVDFRLVAASKADLAQASKDGEFREDLYYRLNVAQISIPPLRERREDIPLLFHAFTQEMAQHYQREPFALSQADLHALMAHHWAGNVRELKNIAERFVLGKGRQKIAINELLKRPEQTLNAQTWQQQIHAFEKTILQQALSKHQGQVQPILDELALPRRTFNEILKKHALTRKDFTA